MNDDQDEYDLTENENLALRQCAEAALMIVDGHREPRRLSVLDFRARFNDGQMVISEKGPFSIIVVGFDEGEPRRLCVEDLVVEEERRGAGYGTRLIKEILRVADDRGLDVVLSANPLEQFGDPSREAAFDRLVRFYERLGFTHEYKVEDGNMIRRAETSPSNDP